MLYPSVCVATKHLVRRPGHKLIKNLKLETLLKNARLLKKKTKNERVCAKIKRSVKDVTFDQGDAAALQERLALVFAEFAKHQDEVMTLDDVDME